MRAEASSPSLKKVWKSVVRSTVTAVTVIGGFFGIYSFTFSWTYQPKTKGLAGTFTSTAADASGSSIASRVLH